MAFKTKKEFDAHYQNTLKEIEAKTQEEGIRKWIAEKQYEKIVSVMFDADVSRIQHVSTALLLVFFVNVVISFSKNDSPMMQQAYLLTLGVMWGMFIIVVGDYHFKKRRKIL